MKIVLLLAAFILIALLPACTSTVQTDNEVIQSDNRITNSMPEVWFTYPSTTYEYDYPVYPAKVTIDNLSAGSIVDTWVSDGQVENHPEYSWKRGEFTTVNIHNRFPEATTFNLIFKTPDSQYDYHPEAIFVKPWVTLSATSLLIPSGAVAHVPIRIIVPESIPTSLKSTEFWIQVTPEIAGSVQYSVSSRWIISLR